MDKSIAIFAASVLGLSVGAGTMLYVNNAQVDTKPQEIAPVVVSQPAQPVNTVTVKDDYGVSYTVMRENVSCKTYDYNGEFERDCTAHAKRTDLAGYSMHDSNTQTCYKSNDGGLSWKRTRFDSWVCRVVHKLEAS